MPSARLLPRVKKNTCNTGIPLTLPAKLGAGVEKWLPTKLATFHRLCNVQRQLWRKQRRAVDVINPAVFLATLLQFTQLFQLFDLFAILLNFSNDD